jgi:pimeloyl-ACP methyl ester carboxylesterase
MPIESNRKRQRLELGGVKLGYFESGSGTPVIVFAAENEQAPDLLLTGLAESHRVISFDPLGEDYKSASGWLEKLPLVVVTLAIGRCCAIGISAGAPPALALALAAPERIEKLLLLSPLLAGNGESLDLDAVEAATLVLVGTRDSPGAVESGRRCRQSIPSCHLSFIYGAGHVLSGERREACLEPILQFLKEGEEFIIFRKSQLIRA